MSYNRYGGGRSNNGSGRYGNYDGDFTGRRFDESRDNCSHVYTDGACHDNGRSGARGGVGVYWGDNDPGNYSAPLQGRQTNNRAEIQSARHAIIEAKDRGIDNLVIHSDSKFLRDGATKWTPNWKQNDWTLSTGGPVKNRQDFEQLDRDSQGINVKYEYTPAHSGVYGNEQANKLAGQGARRY